MADVHATVEADGRLHVVAELRPPPATQNDAGWSSRAWAEIADFGRVDRLLPSVVQCRLVGEGVGARRHLVTADGATVVSELVELDPVGQVMAYAIVESGLPLDDYLSRVTVLHDGVRWESWCHPSPGAEAEVRALLEHQLVAGVERIVALALGG